MPKDKKTKPDEEPENNGELLAQILQIARVIEVGFANFSQEFRSAIKEEVKKFEELFEDPNIHELSSQIHDP